MKLVSWVVGGGIGVALAIGILVTIANSKPTRTDSSRDREQVAAYVSDATARAASSETRSSARLPMLSDSGEPGDDSIRETRIATAAPASGRGSSKRLPSKPRAEEDSASDAAVEPDAEKPALPRIAVPSPEARATSEKRLRQVFDEEFAAAVDPDSKRSLAIELLRKVDELSDDAGAHFALLNAVTDLAIESAEPALAFFAVDRMAERFEIDQIAVRSRILSETADEVRSDAWRIEAGAEALRLGRECMAMGRTDETVRLATLADHLAREADSDSLEQAAAALQAALGGETGGTVESVALVEAKAAYETSSNEADACERYGTLLCLEKADWFGGLPLLVQSEDPQIRAAAEADVASPTSPTERIELADAWSRVAQRGDEYAGFATRARRWYELAQEEATGLDRIHVQKQLESLATFAVASPPPTPSAAPTVVDLELADMPTSSRDLWDLTQGCRILSRSDIAEGSDIRSAFGASVSKSPLAPGIKDGTLFDAAPGGTLHFVEWTTERYVEIGRIGIVFRSDLKSLSHGNAETLRIRAWDPFAEEFRLLVDLPGREREYRQGYSQTGLTLLPTGEPGEVSLYVDIEPVLSNRFRAEFVQAGAPDAKFVGPMVMELEAYAAKRDDRSEAALYRPEARKSSSTKRPASGAVETKAAGGVGGGTFGGEESGPFGGSGGGFGKGGGGFDGGGYGGFQ